MRPPVTATGKNVDCWPNREQELLLKAAFLQDQECVEALCEWETCCSMDDVDEGSFRLLPYLHYHFEEQGLDHPLMPIWKGIRRRAWYQNRMLFHKTAPVIGQLQKAGIEATLLNGAAVASRYYADPGVRPMHDLNILVPEERALDALDLMRRGGWNLATWSPRVWTQNFLSYRDSVALHNPDGPNIELHWHVMNQAGQPGQDRVFRDAALPFDFMGLRAKILCPTDELLRACVQGLRWKHVPHIRWVADCLSILRSEAEIEWGRLMQIARDIHATMPLAHGLAYLKDTFGAPIPEDVPLSLQSVPVSKSERLYYYRLACPLEVRNPIDIFRATYWRYLHTTARGGVFQRYLAGFLPFLQMHWQLPSPWSLAPLACRWARLRIIRL